MLSTLPVIKRTTEETVEAVNKTTTETAVSSGIPTWCLILIIVLGSLLLAAVVFMIVYFVKEKKKKKKTTPQPVYQQPVARPKKEEPEAVVESHSNHTQKLWSNGSAIQKERNSVLIRDIAYPERFYKVAVDGGVVIGRSTGDVIISYDRFISSRHCELSYSNGILYVQDLGSANGTFYENQKIQRKTAVINGGIIKIGETELKLEVVKEKC